MSDDYIRDEFQRATTEYIKAVRPALARTKDARKAAGGGGLLRTITTSSSSTMIAGFLSRHSSTI